MPTINLHAFSQVPPFFTRVKQQQQQQQQQQQVKYINSTYFVRDVDAIYGKHATSFVDSRC